jgi:hypothetical protein
MIIKLNDDKETVIDLKKASWLQKRFSYEDYLNNPKVPITAFCFYIAIGLEKLEILYSIEPNTLKKMDEVGKIFLADYKLIEDYFLSKDDLS